MLYNIKLTLGFAACAPAPAERLQPISLRILPLQYQGLPGTEFLAALLVLGNYYYYYYYHYYYYYFQPLAKKSSARGWAVKNRKAPGRERGLLWQLSGGPAVQLHDHEEVLDADAEFASGRVRLRQGVLRRGVRELLRMSKYAIRWRSIVLKKETDG